MSGYYNYHKIVYYSKRYDEFVTVPVGYWSDGATGAFDISSKGWWVHDVLCDRGSFDDGFSCTNLQASMVLYDILELEGRYIRKYTWAIMTFLFGGGKARKNGMVNLK